MIKMTDEEILAQAIRDVESDVTTEDDYEAPKYVEKDSYYKLLRELMSTKDSTKIANLSSEELGKSELSIRGSLKLALLCDTLNIVALGDCYRKEAEILASTSMARYVKGSNLLNLMFTQIKKSVSNNDPQQPQKSSWFSKKNDYGSGE